MVEMGAENSAKRREETGSRNAENELRPNGGNEETNETNFLRRLRTISFLFSNLSNPAYLNRNIFNVFIHFKQ